MNQSVITAIFATGLAAAGWVGWGFIGHSPLALAMTVMIAATYLLGAWELMRYRAATVSLTRYPAHVCCPDVSMLCKW